MAPPPQIDGYVVPGFVSWKYLRLNVHPRNLYDELKALPGFDVKELAWDFEQEKKAEQGVPFEVVPGVTAAHHFQRFRSVMS